MVGTRTTVDRTDRVDHSRRQAATQRTELTPAEERLLGDLFAIVEEHAAQAAVAIDRDRVEDAFVYACVHHADQRRRTGEDFITHPVGVAKICAGMRLDTETLCSSLLHDTVEDTSASLQEVTDAFGEEIAGMVDGVTKRSEERRKGKECDSKCKSLWSPYP